MRVLCRYFDPNTLICGSTRIYAGMFGTLHMSGVVNLFAAKKKISYNKIKSDKVVELVNEGSVIYGATLSCLYRRS